MKIIIILQSGEPICRPLYVVGLLILPFAGPFHIEASLVIPDFGNMIRAPYGIVYINHFVYKFIWPFIIFQVTCVARNSSNPGALVSIPSCSFFMKSGAFVKSWLKWFSKCFAYHVYTDWFLLIEKD